MLKLEQFLGANKNDSWTNNILSTKAHIILYLIWIRVVVTDNLEVQIAEKRSTPKHRRVKNSEDDR